MKERGGEGNTFDHDRGTVPQDLLCVCSSEQPAGGRESS